MNFLIGDKVETREGVPGVNLSHTPIGTKGTVTRVDDTASRVVYGVQFDTGHDFSCYSSTLNLIERPVPPWHPGAKTRRRLVL